MSRIIGVTLLLIILVYMFYDSSASHVGVRVPKALILKCRCRVFPNGKKMCRSPLIPTNPVKRQDLVKCLCSKTNQHKFPKLLKACSSRRPYKRGDIPIPITLL